MARPMMLIKPNLIEDLHKLNSQGVPIARLIRDRNLALTIPTLAKLLSYYQMALTQADSLDGHKIKQLILASLFPAWLLGQQEDITFQDCNLYKYKGKMPFGEWQEVQPSEVE